ncbi:hypothetical protein MY10362_000706 [Beauveria mimosiformis]
MSGVFPHILKEATDQYGPLVRIGPNQLVSSDPEVLRRMSAVRGNYIKARFYKAARIVPGVDNVVSALDEDKHKAMRAQMNSTFTVKNDDEYGFEAAVDRQIHNFITMLETKYTSTDSEIRPVDMAEKAQFLALDIIGDISIGKPFGYLRQDQDLYNFNEINMFVTKSVEAAMHRNEAKEGALIQKHVHHGLTKNDMIQQGFVAMYVHFCASSSSRANVHASIAGSNTTAHTILMTLLSIIAAPWAFQALRKEIDEARPSVHDPISWHELRQLPYLQAVIKECLRMWPPVSGLGFKLVPPGGEHINGHFVPGGTEIGQAFLAVGRSKQIWGADADIFRPERWLCASEADLNKMNKAVDTHFGGGKFSCLGKPIAMMELQKTVYELMKRFDMAIIHPDKPMKTKASIFVCDTDFWVTLRKRPTSNQCQN